MVHSYAVSKIRPTSTQCSAAEPEGDVGAPLVGALRSAVPIPGVGTLACAVACAHETTAAHTKPPPSQALSPS
jgi:hypothetical protein